MFLLANKDHAVEDGTVGTRVFQTCTVLGPVPLSVGTEALQPAAYVLV